MRTSGSILPRESSESEIPARFAHRLLWPSHDTAKRKGPHRQTRMRVLHRDPKTGEIKVRVENPDDLWHLHNLLQPGDLVCASTYRREDVKTDKLRPERGEKVRVTLTIRVEDVEFQAFSDRLRVSGVIVEGPQDLGRHHTLNVGVEDILSIIKTWKSHELRRIDEAVAAAQKPLEAIATDRPVAYGPAEVQESADAGAIETLLVSDAVVRNPGIEELMRTAESARGTVVLVSRHHEAGKKLEALGGIAALLRFAIK